MYHSTWENELHAKATMPGIGPGFWEEKIEINLPVLNERRRELLSESLRRQPNIRILAGSRLERKVDEEKAADLVTTNALQHFNSSAKPSSIQSLPVV